MPSLTSSLGDLFSSTRRQDTQTASQQQAQSQFGLTPQVQDYWSSISGLYNPSQWNPVANNQWQDQAAQAQAGYASGLNPSFGAATGIAQGGISTADINRFMSPYTQNVVDATRADFERSNALARTQDQSRAALAGVPLRNGTQAGVGRMLGDYTREKAQAPVIAGLYNQGYQQAADMAGRSTQAQLGGIGAAANTAGQQGNLTNTLFGQGTQFWNQGWQNNLMPFQLAGMGADTLGRLVQGSGTTSSGSSTGTGTTTQTATPSPFDMFRTVGGLGLQAASLFSDERMKDNIKEIGETYDGQPIYKFNYKGSPVTTIGLMAQDVEGRDPSAVGSVSGLKTVDYDRATKGAERRMAGGGAVSAPSDPHEKFVKAFDTISGLISRSKGGSVLKPYADGGPIGSWATTVEPASSGFSMEKLGQFGQDLQNTGASSKGEQGKSGDGDLGVNSALASTQANLSNLMGSMRPRFDGGGAVEWGERGPVFPEVASASGLSPMMRLGAPVERSEIAPVGSLDRSAFSSQLEDPKTRAALLALTHAEVGGQGPEAQQAFLESVFNRASARGKSLSDTIYDRGYYPSVTYDRMGGAIPEARYVPILDKVMGGSNVAKYATGNASGTVGFNGGPQTVAFNGERFGIEGPDRKWATASRLPNMGADPEGARLAASMRTVPMAARETRVASADPVATSPTTATDAPKKSWLDYILPGRNDGVWGGKPATNLQRMGAALMAGGPGDGIAQNIMAWEANRQKEREINQAAEALAGQITINGKTVPSVAGRNVALGEALNPAQIRQADAAAKKLELDADKDFQLAYQRQFAEMQKEVARADLEEKIKMGEKYGFLPQQQQSKAPWADPSGGANTRLQWNRNQTPQQAAPQPVVPQTPIGPQPSPIPPPPSYQPPADSPAGKAAAKRIEAGNQMRASAEKRQAEQRAVQGQFDADADKLSPYDFMQKYGNQRQNLTSAQISRLNQMIDAAARGP